MEERVIRRQKREKKREEREREREREREEKEKRKDTNNFRFLDLLMHLKQTAKAAARGLQMSPI